MRGSRAMRAAFAAALLMCGGLVASACQVALRADGEDARCNIAEGSKCPGTELTCQNGRCLPCTPHDESCNGIDDNCNGEIDEGFDKDQDGYTTCGTVPGGGTDEARIDCNDDPDLGGATIHPGATEVCNGVDDNCNHLTDEGTCPGQVCWPDKKGCKTTGDCCTFKDDCRKVGGSCPKGLGCNPTTGYCDARDCTTDGCPISGYECDMLLRACVRKIALGDPCNPPAEPCAAGAVICVETKPLGITRAGRVCAMPCCASEDCPVMGGFVCKYTAAGASMCVRATDVGLPTPGTGQANTKCSTGSTCRSGVCSGGICTDGCCGSETCGAGGTCSVKGDARFLCRDSGGSGSDGDSCGSSGCKSGVCFNYGWTVGTFCSKRCCTSFDCKADEGCVVQKLGTDTYMPVCIYLPSMKFGSKKGGELCGASNECRSGTCTDGRCREICCHDSDCDPATVCKPSDSGALRCLLK